MVTNCHRRPLSVDYHTRFHMLSKLLPKVCFLVAYAWIVGVAAGAPFSSTSNLVVMRCTNGAGAEKIFLDEYQVNGASPVFVQAIELPSSGTDAVTMPGITNHDRHLHRSANEGCLTLAGYHKSYAYGGQIDPSSESAAVTPRVIAIIQADGTYDLSTKLTDSYDATTVRGAASTDGIKLWLAGDNSGGDTVTGGLRYTTRGSSTSVNLSQVQVNGGPKTPDNIRDLGIYGWQLYNCSGSGSSVGKAVFRVGVGLPTSGSQQLTTLTTDDASSTSFVFLDADPAVAGVDTLYSATSTGSTLRKYNLVGGAWIAKGLVVGTTDVKQVTARLEAGQAIIFAFHAGQIYRLTDSTPYGGTLSGTFSSLTPYITTGSNPFIVASDFTLGGCDFAPGSPSPTLTSAVSRKTHGAAGDFDIPLSTPMATGESECRAGGPTRIVVQFDRPIVAADGHWDAGPADEIRVSSVPSGAIAVSNVVAAGAVLAFDLSGVPNRGCLTIVLHGIATDTGGGAAGGIMADITMRQRVLKGDTRNTGRITSADVNATKARFGAATSLNFRNDINADGLITVTDLNEVKGATNAVQVACP